MQGHKDFKKARIKAGQSQIQASVEIGVSYTAISNLEVRGDWPKNSLHIRAIRAYIKKYAGGKK